MVGLYLLVADDDWPYASTTEWEPELPDYMKDANVLYLSFVNPGLMPDLPPAMQHISMNREKMGPGTKVIAAIGGQAYSDKKDLWPWLQSESAAEAMAVEVYKWRAQYGIDGVDLDIETGAGSSEQSGP